MFYLVPTFFSQQFQPEPTTASDPSLACPASTDTCIANGKLGKVGYFFCFVFFFLKTYGLWRRSNSRLYESPFILER